ncbi:MAG: Chromosome partition protein Smc [Chlamydiae bacterium]|nr:Chromosome partition protein Smc [Chlamydiota bacterium]
MDNTFDIGPISFNPCNSICNPGSEGGIKGRFCSNWRMIPGILTLAASIIGIVCAVMWNYPFLTIPFGAGATGSTYLIYLGYTFKHLQSLEASTVKLEAELEEVTQQNETYKQQNEEHQEKLNEFQEKIGHLEEVKTQIENFSTVYGKELGDIIKSLQELQTNGVKNTEDFEKKLTQLNEQIETLSNLKSINPETVKQLTEASKAISQTLKETVDSIDWKKASEALNTQTQTLKSLTTLSNEAKNQHELTEQQTQNLKSEVKALQREANQLTESNATYTELNQTLEQNLSSLTELIEQLSQPNVGNEETQKQLLEEIQKLNLAIKRTPFRNKTNERTNK